MLFLWQVASSAAHAANANAQAWTEEEWRDLIVGVVGAMWLGFTTWQNAVLKKQNDQISAQIAVHEERATERARLRGGLPAAGPSDERQV
jgi:hypothetical protein